MTQESQNAFFNYLTACDVEQWQRALDTLTPEIHEVDCQATRIWFHFYPLDLFLVLQEADDAEMLARDLLLEGNYQLATQVDTSAHFLYAHRFWKTVKQTLADYAFAHTPQDNRYRLEDIAREVARRAAQSVKQDVSLLLGISLVALMTLRQVGLEMFNRQVDEHQLAKMHPRKSPEQVLRERTRDNTQGLFGFLKRADKEWVVTHNERQPDYHFKCLHGEELASAAARDTSREWHKLDARCVEGPIPVQCRAAACGFCWVGVLGGADKLTPVTRHEGEKMKDFGYINTDDERPLIRLACMAQAEGAVSIVIPPWNGFYGKYLKRRATGESGAQDEALPIADSNG